MPVEDYRQPVRPFLPGEFRPNADGSRSTEILVTVQDPATGKWVNVPSLWMTPGGPRESPNDDISWMTAQRYEAFTGMRFPRFDTMDDAVSSARSRSDGGGASHRSLAMPVPKSKPSTERPSMASSYAPPRTREELIARLVKTEPFEPVPSVSRGGGRSNFSQFSNNERGGYFPTSYGDMNPSARALPVRGAEGYTPTRISPFNESRPAASQPRGGTPGMFSDAFAQQDTRPTMPLLRDADAPGPTLQRAAQLPAMQAAANPSANLGAPNPRALAARDPDFLSPYQQDPRGYLDRKGLDPRAPDPMVAAAPQVIQPNRQAMENGLGAPQWNGLHFRAAQEAGLRGVGVDAMGRPLQTAAAGGAPPAVGSGPSSMPQLPTVQPPAQAFAQPPVNPAQAITLGALAQAGKPQLPVTGGATGATMLSRGQGQPEAVMALQTALNRAGFNSGEADGDFGPVTERAVMDFQRSKGLEEDGIVGPKTQAAIDKISRLGEGGDDDRKTNVHYSGQKDRDKDLGDWFRDLFR
jgi:hypothetical protein